MKVEREKLLSVLDLVSPGLAQSKEVIQQSASFVFNKGNVITFNDETACIQKSPIELKGAVQARPFRAILQRLKEEVIDVDNDKKKITIKGKGGKRTNITMEKDITLPLKHLDIPKKWYDLPESFGDAVQFVKDCASTDASYQALMCVHITPKYVEAFDNDQYAMHKCKIKKLKQDILIPARSLQHVIPLAATHFSVTKAWMHFKNENGLIFSCRRILKKYQDCTKLRKLEGTNMILPSGLDEAAHRGEVFAADGADDNQVTINLSKNRVEIYGEGQYGNHFEPKKVKYRGKPLSFMISPALLTLLMKQQQYDCVVHPKALKVEGTKTIFITALNTPAEVAAMRKEKQKKKEKEEKENEGE